LAATERGKLKVGCTIAANRVGAEAGTLKGPRTPHIISVDGDAVRDSVEVIDLPERVSERPQHEPFRCRSSWILSLRAEEVLGDYPVRCDPRECPAGQLP